MNTPSCARQRGQSLVEFLIVTSLVLVPLLMLVPVLAQMISLRQDTEIAARYAAWERTVWFQPGSRSGDFAPTTARDDATIARHIEQRVLSAAGYGVYTAQSEAEPVLDPFLKVANSATGQQEYLVRDRDAADEGQAYVSQRSTEEEPPGMTGWMNDVVKTYGAISPRFDLNTKGLYEATVSLELIDLSWLGEPFDQSELFRYERSNTLFAEPWNAGGPEHARQLISGMVAATMLDNGIVGAMQSAAGKGFASRELEADSLIFGYVDIEPMPAHRLSRY